MAIDLKGRIIYISDFDNNRIRKYDIVTTMVTTVATDLDAPFGIAFDALSDCLYVASNSKHTIYKIPLVGTSLPIAISNNYKFAGSPGTE